MALFYCSEKLTVEIEYHQLDDMGPVANFGGVTSNPLDIKADAERDLHIMKLNVPRAEANEIGCLIFVVSNSPIGDKGR